MRDRYSFRFTHDEILEMRHILEGNAYSRPPRAEMEGLAFSFSKVREQQGMPVVRLDSVHRWFKRNRRAYLNSVERMDSSPQQGPALSEVDSILARLAGYRKDLSGAGADSQQTSQSSNLSTVSEAINFLEKLKDMSLSDFRKYQADFRYAVKILLEQGSLSESEKAELSSLPERLGSIAIENEQIRKELADEEAFMAMLLESEESTNKLVEKALTVEENYNSFPQKLSICSQKTAELEAELDLAKPEAEKLKCDREDAAAELDRLAERLESANTHHKILKAEEAAVIDKKIESTECLQKNAKEWVKLTTSKTFTYEIKVCSQIDSDSGLGSLSQN